MEGTYKQWMVALDHVDQTNLGVSVHDIPDMLTRSAYDEGRDVEDFYENEVMAEVGYMF